MKISNSILIICFVIILVESTGSSTSGCPPGFQSKHVAEKVCDPRSPGRCRMMFTKKCLAIPTPMTSTTTTTTTTAGTTSSRSLIKKPKCLVKYLKDCQENRVPRCKIVPKKVCTQESHPDQDGLVANSEEVVPVQAIQKCRMEYAKMCNKNQVPRCRVVLTGCSVDGGRSQLPNVNDPDGKDADDSGFEQKVAKPKTIEKVKENGILDEEPTEDESENLDMEYEKKDEPLEKKNESLAEEPLEKKPEAGEEKVKEEPEEAVKTNKPLETEEEKKNEPIEEEKGFDQSEYSKDILEQSVPKESTGSCKSVKENVCTSVGRGRTLCQEVSKYKCDHDPDSGPNSGQDVGQLPRQDKQEKSSKCPPKQEECSPVKVCRNDPDPFCHRADMEQCRVMVQKNSMRICHSVVNKFCDLNPAAFYHPEASLASSSDVQCWNRSTVVCNTQYVIELETTNRLSCVHVPRITCNMVQAPSNPESGIMILGGGLVENCTQSFKQVCRRFPMLEPNPKVMTDCRDVSVTRCTRIGDQDSDRFELVRCQDKQAKLCGRQETSELIPDECTLEQRTECRPGTKFTCSETGQQKCRSVSYNPDGSECQEE